MTTYLLVRHGTTEWVDTNLLHGITDVPLNQRGQDQAAAAAQALADANTERIYTSTLSRCAETAQIIGKSTNLHPILMDSLVEIDFGWMEGKKIRDHDYGDHSKWVEFIDHHIFNLIRFFSGETKLKFNKRVLGGWSQILNENQSGIVIVVAHSGVLNTILLHHFGRQYLGGDAYHHLNPCSITEIAVDDAGSARMIRLNDNTHIPDSLQRA